jgi:hypothetical protein
VRVLVDWRSRWALEGIDGGDHELILGGIRRSQSSRDRADAESSFIAQRANQRQACEVFFGVFRLVFAGTLSCR